MIVFDLDGTILNSFRRHEVAMAQSLEQVGLSADLSTLKSFKRRGFSNLDWLKFNEFSTVDMHEIAVIWEELIENEDLLALDFVYDDVFEALNSLNRQPLVLCTARKNVSGLHKQLVELGLSPYFQTVVQVLPGRGAGLRKAHALRGLKVFSFFGDTEDDLVAALEIGATPYMLSQGFRSESFWIKSGHCTFRSLNDAVRAAINSGFETCI